MYFKTNTNTNEHVISSHDIENGKEFALSRAEYETLKGLSWINYANKTTFGDIYEFGDLTGLGKIIFNKIINKGDV